MADSKLTALTEDASPGTDSVIYTIDDPAGSPVDRKVTLANLITLVEANITSGGGIKMLGVLPPVANAATITYVSGGSTPGERMQAWAFDPSTVEYMDFLCRAESYSSGGLTVSLAHGSGATTGNVLWSAAIRRIADDAEQISVSHSYDYNDASADATPSATTEWAYVDITFTDGADMDSVAQGELFILRVRRRADQAGDTLNSNDAYLLLPTVKET